MFVVGGGESGCVLWQLQVVNVGVFVLGGKAGVIVVGAITAGGKSECDYGGW